MRILITGGCGFIGSNYILNHLSKNNDSKILNIDKLTYAGNINNIPFNKKNYSIMNADICDFKTILKTVHQFQPDFIVHFAAESHVDRSIDDPMNFINTNIVGTASILHASLDYWKNSKNSNFRFLHVSTDEVYGSLGPKGYFNETTPYNPSSPYSASKASSDHLVRAWNKTYGLPINITNCSNNYGPFQFPEKLIPLMIANCFDQKELPVYGEGKNIRDWLYVIDHCDAIDIILNQGEIGQTYNIGGNNEITNIDIVITICSVLDELKPRSNGEPYSNLISFVTDRPGHDFRYAIDASKIKEVLNWAPKETFVTGIKKTIKWYLDNERWWRNIQNGTYSQERLGLDES